MALRDQPYLPLYIKDIMTDEKLNECSASTHGIYIKGIMCLMHKSDTYGKILLKQKYKQNSSKEKDFACQLAKQLPYTVDEIFEAISELINEKVCFYEGDFIVQKRMVKDNLLSEQRAKAGKEGGQQTQLKNKKSAKANTEANAAIEYVDEDVIENENKEEKESEFSFFKFWELYDKKVGDKEQLSYLWQSLADEEKKKAIKHIPEYKKAVPVKRYRKDPLNYLTNKGFNDEVISIETTSEGIKIQELVDPR